MLSLPLLPCLPCPVPACSDFGLSRMLGIGDTHVETEVRPVRLHGIETAHGCCAPVGSMPKLTPNVPKLTPSALLCCSPGAELWHGCICRARAAD